MTINEKNFTSGSVLTASDVNTYLMNQVVKYSTSGTRPASPAEGQVIYDRDTDQLLVYASSTAGVQWKAPWNLPWGEVSGSRTSSTSLATAFSSATDLLTTGSITIPQYRRIQVCGNISLSASATGDEARVYVVVDSTTLQIDQQVTTASKATTFHPQGTYVSDGSAHTFKLAAVRQSGSGTLTVVSASTFPSELWLVDLGPTHAPA